MHLKVDWPGAYNPDYHKWVNRNFNILNNVLAFLCLKQAV